MRRRSGGSTGRSPTIRTSPPPSNARRARPWRRSTAARCGERGRTGPISPVAAVAVPAVGVLAVVVLAVVVLVAGAVVVLEDVDRALDVGLDGGPVRLQGRIERGSGGAEPLLRVDQERDVRGGAAHHEAAFLLLLRQQRRREGEGLAADAPVHDHGSVLQSRAGEDLQLELLVGPGGHLGIEDLGDRAGAQGGRVQVDEERSLAGFDLVGLPAAAVRAPAALGVVVLAVKSAVAPLTFQLQPAHVQADALHVDGSGHHQGARGGCGLRRPNTKRYRGAAAARAGEDEQGSEADDQAFHRLFSLGADDGQPDGAYTGNGGDGTGELEMNACAGILLLRPRGTLVRCRLPRPDADLARPEELDRLRSGLGARLGRPLPRGDRQPQMGATQPPHVRSACPRTATDGALEPPLWRSAGAENPRRRPPRALGALRRGLRFRRLQSLPRRP